MTVVNPKSISGITSITTASGSDNLLTIHTSDANNTERFRIDSTGTTKIVTGIVTTLTATGSAKVGSGITLSPDGHIFATGITTVGKSVFLSGQNPNIRFDDSDTTNNGEITLDNTQLRIEVDEDNSRDSSQIRFRVDGDNIATVVSTGLQLTATNPEFEMNAGGPRFRVPSANTLSIFTSGGIGATTNERLRITNNGDIGVNQSSPHTISGYTGLTINHATHGGFVQFQDDGTNTSRVVGGPNAIEINTQTSIPILFKTAGDNERARIESAGNVKIEKNLNVVGVCTANTVEDSIGDLRKFPITTYSSNVVVASHHAGKTLTNTSGGWTVNSDTDFATGEVMRVVNKSGSGQIVYQGGSATLYSSRDSGTSGDHTIKARGSAILICTGTDEYYLSGDI